ncbi:MAG: A/G-specific adenine glycosylase [Gammaproteobacteria bacterium]|nr:A/G-specific adenine glycosylase [Rhodocyclaceae bacterium]MBU3908112.1 A/G-specific adenine glycosylase [Gammaproteobacteria bacterium]MBU3989007.1 A/G-specific adenine glycosylase [Gammaproteobacteria bacterium]MBU4005753.1 A/G-specific adenine glycosylase [Gammaproteobacteria bacterium]MBU4021499.1 A/G-specific adenine glycosylase [Gammaproteobacteria bacterium]
MPSFAKRLIDWQASHGRRDLPWQQTTDPYRVWLSEIMLQQTQVATVIGYYTRFLERFPSLEALAAAPVEDVMVLWSGLGYYARARNLHACARTLVLQHGGLFPRDPAALARLPGIGRSTANAIAVFCFGARAPILDGNVKRLLCRYLGIAGFPGTPAVESRLWQDAAALLPAEQVAAYIQAQMDMGATICTRRQPRCPACPVGDRCVARNAQRVAELPTPRPRKVLPERTVTLLILRAENFVLLETRPPAGIWGGLLSLPELPVGSEAVDYCVRQLGVHVSAVAPAPTFSHGFTHFRLHIQPLHCVAEIQPRLAEPALRWVRMDELAQTALPAPIRAILTAIP